MTPKKEPYLTLFALHPPDCAVDSETYDPIAVFEELFGYYNLVDVRNYLYEMFKMASSRPDLKECCDSEDNFFFTFEFLNDVVTAAYMLARSRHDSSNLLLTQ